MNLFRPKLIPLASGFEENKLREVFDDAEHTVQHGLTDEGIAAFWQKYDAECRYHRPIGTSGFEYAQALGGRMRVMPGVREFLFGSSIAEYNRLLRINEEFLDPELYADGEYRERNPHEVDGIDKFEVRVIRKVSPQIS